MRSLFVKFARLLLLLPLILLVPHLFGFPFPSPEARFSDLVISHYPNAVFLQEAFRQYGSGIPLWSPTILSGYPFMADPLSGLHYPPGWLAFLLPLPFGMNLIAGLHLVFGAWGFYRLLRHEGLDFWLALWGGVSFGLSPKLFAHFGAGHLTLLYAVPWTPWLLLATRQYFSPGTQGSLARIQRINPGNSIIQIFHPLSGVFQPGVLLGLIFLADPRWAFYAGLAWVGYLLAFVRISSGLSAWGNLLLKVGWQIILAFLVAAPLALPLWQYASLSTRAQLLPAEIFTYSFEPVRLIGLLFPGLEKFHEWVVYSGCAILVLAGLGLQRRGAGRSGKYYLFLVLLGLLLSFGGHLPGMEYLVKIPGLSLLRVPPRALFLVGLGLIGLAVHAAAQLRVRLPDLDIRRGTLTLVTLGLLVVFLAVPLAAALPGQRGSLIAGAVVASLVVLLTVLRLHDRISFTTWLVVIILISVSDLLFASQALFTSRRAQAILAEGRELIAQLPRGEGLFRVYSPSYSLPQQSAVHAGLQLADGVDPLQLRAYATFLLAASGVPGHGYSVTLPAFGQGDPVSANRDYVPDSVRLGLLNVRYLVSAFPLESAGLKLVSMSSAGYIYENNAVLPRAWLQPVDADLGKSISPVLALRWSPNRIVVDVPIGSLGARAEQLLVLSEINYPGWLVRVDGETARLETVAGVLRAVRVPPATRQVVFEFQPTSLYIGLVSAALGIALSLVGSTLRLLGFNLRGLPV